MSGKRKGKRLKLYVLIYAGIATRLHSIDYPKAWHVKRAAMDYWLEIPEEKRESYAIVQFLEVRP